jgi:DNA-nicking Smr family endonuclease
MSRRPKDNKPAEGPLSSEERLLWRIVAERVRPLGAKPRVPERDADSIEATATASRREAAPPPARRAKAHVPVPKAIAPEPPAPPPLAAFDRRKARRIARGQVEIEGRIDLHGMRQAEAHAALRRFLLECHAAGRGTVLVITGKGGAPSDGRDDATRLGMRERGVLRRNVPRWLTEPELRGIVVSYTEAGLAHGGEGALYVLLRRQRVRD